MVKGNEYRTTVVCVDSYRNSVMKGRFYNVYCGEAAFESLTELLLKVEDLLDGMKLPQSFSARRSFGDTGMTLVEAEGGGEAQSGRLATFGVRILFRQNASWQGSVSWLEGGREESFRSVLELILLMDSALRSEKKE